MDTAQLSELIAELRGIKIALYCAVTLIAIVAISTAVRTYFAFRLHLDREFDEQFKHEAAILFEKHELDKLVSRCRDMLGERPNHAYARWYLGRALLLQEQWVTGLEELLILRRKFPEWARNIDPVVKEARSKLEAGGNPVASQ
jgi:hypothetical protein